MSLSDSQFYYKFLDDSNSDDWNYLLCNSDDVGFFHDIQLNNYYQEKEGAKNISFLVYIKDQKIPVAGCPLYMIKENSNKFYRRERVIALSFYNSGPFIHKRLGSQKRREILNVLSKFLKELQLNYDISKLTLSYPPLSRLNINTPQVYTNPLHELRDNWLSIPKAYYYLDLSKSEIELFNGLEVRTKTIIRKFEKEMPYIIKKVGKEHSEDFFSLYMKTQRRNNMPLHQKSIILWLLSFYRSNCFMAFKGSIPVCVINVGLYENTGIYWLNYNDEEYLKDGISTYLLWYSILQAKNSGIIHFELGDQPFLKRGDKFDSIANFKRSFGGELRYKFYSVYEPYSKLKQFIIRIANALL